ncbi:MAG: 30S ribosomal protein S12 methylthiotransferase RimO, partial [Clostridia bacterium]|nr:30S ribosomal protein S12 methylthiotransferase RimO [Clostridia bacterium]
MTNEKIDNFEEVDFRNKKVSAISLGCDKNRVDLEHMLFSLQTSGFEIVSDIEGADIIIVNTCAFIKPAIDETVDNINLAIKQKIIGSAEKIIVSGCYPQRNIEKLGNAFPQVDCFLPLNQNCNIVNVIKNLYSSNITNCTAVNNFLLNSKDASSKFIGGAAGRVITHNGMYAYLKIADGCSNGCAYCTIPKIRGRFRSVPMDNLIKEAKTLAQNGYKELILVAQDTAKYGDDVYGEPKLIELLKNLIKIKDLEWIRLQYVYPKWLNDELLNFIATEEKMCKYIDMPLQHIDDEILRAMNRKSNEQQTLALLNKIKINYPQIILRSTFIIGLPGETKQKFNKLCDFISKGIIDYATFFPYYREVGTKAYYMKKQVFDWVKKKRIKKITKIQNIVMNLNNQKKLGLVEEVLIDEYFPQQKIFKGHSKNNSPNIDLCVIIDKNYDEIEKGESAEKEEQTEQNANKSCIN